MGLAQAPTTTPWQWNWADKPQYPERFLPDRCTIHDPMFPVPSGCVAGRKLFVTSYCVFRLEYVQDILLQVRTGYVSYQPKSGNYWVAS